MLKFRRPTSLTLALWSGFFLLVLAFSFLPGTSLPMRLLDAIVLSGFVRHLVGYFLVAFWPARSEDLQVALPLAFMALLAGILIEFAQGWAGRDSEFRDVMANAAGIATGCLAGLLVKKIERRSRVLEVVED